MTKNIITISREFGSGGRTVGRLLGEKLGIPCYDKEFIKKIADETGFAPEFVEKNGEDAPSKSIFAYLPAAYPGQGPAPNGMSIYDYLYVIQKKIILDLAQKGPCVIIGRCSDYILRDREDALHAFIYADTAFKAERIVRLYGESEKAPEERLREKDKKRSINYKHFTGREWGDPDNYEIMLRSSAIGVEKCAEILAEICR